jgi:hypothetical protein
LNARLEKYIDLYLNKEILIKPKIYPRVLHEGVLKTGQNE